VAARLKAGVYTVVASAAGFATRHRDQVCVLPGETTSLDIELAIEVEKQQVIVQDGQSTVGLGANENASGLRLQGDDLEALPDDPSDLQSELLAMAGPVPGSDAAEIYVDGFSGATLPAKSAIRAVNINQNPFSARFDRVGFGRIEVLTKAGTDHVHGDLVAAGNDSSFDSRNPFAPEAPPYHSISFNGDLSGPATTHSSYFFNAQRGEAESNAVVSAIVLDSNLNQTPLDEAVPNPSDSIGASGRFDTQLGQNNSLSLRYQFNQNQATNTGVGQFALPSQASDTHGTTTVLQASDTQIFSTKLLNQSQFQYIHQETNQDASSLAPAITVQGAFTGGGNAAGNGNQSQDQHELQDNVSLEAGKHGIQFGGRLRVWRDSVRSEPNFNGQFLFSSLDSYRITEVGVQQGSSPGQIRAQGGGASQFILGAGNPQAAIALFDLGLYWQDEWKLRHNLTWSYGLRFESQNDIHDRADFAPRLALAWAPTAKKGGTPRTVIRAGYGWFYTRFGASYVLQAAQQNGVNQQQYIVASPDFYPNVPAAGTIGVKVPPTVYQISPTLRSPLLMEAQVSVDRQLGRSSTFSLSYSNSRGVHQFLSRNINAPLPGTYNPTDPASGVRPLGNQVSIYQYESGGVFRQKQLILNFRTRVASRVNLFGYYSLNDAKADTAGAGSFPSNQYDLAADWGRDAYDIRQRLYVGGAVSFPGGFQLSPRVTASSGVPFNIVVGEDLNGDGQFNDRPAFATDLSRPSVVMTRLGNFDTDPIPGQRIIPVNLGTGSPQFTTNLRFSKTFSFGPEKAAATSPGSATPGNRKSADRRYGIAFDGYVRNVFNHVNLAPPVGTLGSPLFGESNALSSGTSSANRTINLEVRFSF
jgi:hypothetical protein